MYISLEALWVGADWTGSTFCTNGECVEAAAVAGGVAVRDSKHPDGPSLWFTSDEWIAFLAGVRAGEFDHLDRVR